MFLPGRFIPRPPSKFEDNLFTYAPRLSLLFTVGVFVPGALFEYWISNGHIVGGVIGLSVWLPVLWLYLVEVHEMGRARLALSAPVVILGHLLIGLWFAGLLAV
jgi:hypothetical protein